MKLCLIIQSRIKQYWAHHRLIISLFLLGGIMSSVVFCYFYGNSLKLMKFLTSNDPHYRTYEIWLSDEFSPNIPRPDFEIGYSDIEKLANNKLVESVQVEAFFSQFADGRNVIEGDSAFGTGRISAFWDNKTELMMINGSSDFNAEPNGVVVPDNSSAIPGDVIRINGRELKVIGKNKAPSYFVSYEVFQTIAEVDHALIISKDRLNLEDDPLRTVLEDTFPQCLIETPLARQRSYEKRAVEEMIIVICPVYLVSLISFMYLLRYLMDTTTSMVAVSRIVGARKWQIFGLCLAEALFLCCLGIAVGIGIHIVLYDAVFVHLNALTDLVYRPVDYCIVFAWMMLLSTAVAMFFVRKYALMPPIALRRQVE